MCIYIYICCVVWCGSSYPVLSCQLCISLYIYIYAYTLHFDTGTEDDALILSVRCMGRFGRPATAAHATISWKKPYQIQSRCLHLGDLPCIYIYI